MRLCAICLYNEKGIRENLEFHQSFMKKIKLHIKQTLNNYEAIYTQMYISYIKQYIDYITQTAVQKQVSSQL